MKTRRGIFPNIQESEYPFTIGEVTFYFTSILYRSKFMNRYREEIHLFNGRANNVYNNKYDLDMGLLSLIRLYVLIEKRGFYIKLRGEEITCLDDLRFVLQVEKKVRYGS